jgi:UDP-N-acetylglucosamine 2-epimerase (non-hydrolysing)
MINFYFGTTAEAYKIYPVYKRLNHSHNCKLIFSGQHVEDMNDFPFQANDYVNLFTNSKNPKGVFRFFVWTLKTLLRALIGFRDVEGIIIVQGDTISTLIGTLAAKSNRKTLYHIEAGCRSGKLLSPFPEEITRKLVSMLADFHFAPTEVEFRNLILEGIEDSKILITNGNTAIDNIFDNEIESIRTEKSFCLVTLHRTELLASKRNMKRTLDALGIISNHIDVVLIADSRLLDLVKLNGYVFPVQIQVMEKLPQRIFHDLLRNAKLVITDSGGVQQEMEILGTPTLIHRKVIEQVQNENIYHTKLDVELLLQMALNYKNLSYGQRKSAESPSEKIVKSLTTSYD